MRRLLFLFLGLLLFTGCTSGRKIDRGTDYSSDLKDGEYHIESAYYNSFGYKQSLSFLINKGIITRVSYVETNASGQSRQEVEGKSITWPGCEYNYEQIIDQLYNDTILSQAQSVDTISGATKTVTDYEILQEDLLNAAKLGRKTVQKTDKFSDTYQIVNEPDPVTGSQEQLTVTYVDGVIRAVSIREVSNNAAFYAIGRAYESLAALSEQTRSLIPVTSSSVDSHILERYNLLLEQLKGLRGEE